MQKNVWNEIAVLKDSLSQNESLGRSLTSLIINSKKNQLINDQTSSIENPKTNLDHIDINLLQKELKEKDMLIKQLTLKVDESESKLADSQSSIESLELELKHAQDAIASMFFDKTELENQTILLENQILELNGIEKKDIESYM